MRQKNIRAIMAVVLALSLCPLPAYADEPAASLPGGIGDVLNGLFSTVTGLDAAGRVGAQSGSALYEHDLTPPPPASSLPGLSGAGDVDDGGILLGASGSLYYLREATFEKGGVISSFAYRTLECYDAVEQAWITYASLPEWLECCSATVWNGQIVLFGMTMATDGGVPAHASNPEQRVYRYDIKSSNPAWVRASSAGVPVGAGVANVAGQLKAVGGTRNVVLDYDLSSGAGAQSARLAAPAFCPQVVSHDGALYVYSFGGSLEDAQYGTGSPRLQVVSDGVASDRSAALPALASASGSEYPSLRSAQYGTLASIVDGLLLVGPQSADGASDTYLMGWENQGASFAPYGKRIDNARLVGVAACVYLGELYAIGTSPANPATPVFRATDVLDAAVESGNNGVWRQASDKTLSITFTPDFSRFSHRVSIDGQRIVEGADYDATAGSTVITLRPSFLSGLSLGKHSVTVYFDDEFSDVPAQFSVEAAASSLAEGYTRPASLARASDTVPVVPFVVCGLAAAAVIAIAVRKSSTGS